jgi:hypothetical protein
MCRFLAASSSQGLKVLRPLANKWKLILFPFHQPNNFELSSRAFSPSPPLQDSRYHPAAAKGQEAQELIMTVVANIMG